MGTRTFGPHTSSELADDLKPSALHSSALCIYVVQILRRNTRFRMQSLCVLLQRQKIDAISKGIPSISLRK